MNRKKSILVFWNELPPYAEACLACLADSTEINVSAYRLWHRDAKPFQVSRNNETFDISLIEEESEKFISGEFLNEIDAAYNPKVVLVSGWQHRSLNRKIKEWHRNGVVTVLMFDNTWRGDFRQIMGALWLKFSMGHFFSFCFVPGIGAMKFAKKIGFQPTQIISGLYSCDTKNFRECSKDGSNNRHRFLFVGSLIERKGIRTLIESYKLYRKACRNPWDLVLVGEGPLSGEIVGTGITKLGFQQPPELRKIMGDSAAFVLPSFKEAWGVVIHEATSMGLPVICSKQCGSVPGLVKHGFNGLTFDAGDVEALSRALHKMSHCDELQEWSKNSLKMAHNYSPELWVDSLKRGLESVSPEVKKEVFG